jgi:ribosomal protein S18 acetylase RimI-like enzyme
MPVVVRLATTQDLPALNSVELLAAERFAKAALTAELQKRTVPLHELQAAQTVGQVWVAVKEDNEPVGFLLAKVLDHNLHISEMSVLPSFGRQGIGATLLRAALQHAVHAGLKGVSLTTFATVPWNAPFYAKQCFRQLAQSEIGPGLASLIQQEGELALLNRVTMHWSGA